MNLETISKIGELVIGAAIVLGAIVCLLSAFGIVRLPDVYLRSHAATKSATLGVFIILLAVFLYFMFYLEHTSAKLLLGIVFVFLTSPLAGHLNSRAAYRSGVSLWKGSVRDEMKTALKKEREAEAEQ
ncbi:monovalent cation/H(+) antiporter subunit G [Paenibacillus harenae]|uniref:Multicomponent Na+:H+ antiporter subunit G n=1 Tax=Paenibacillus harenae TaxID=306543 RepID=A0ABT9U412_PAEHA|nr:monovalent cation/H(+) antiporter subunit G [Paenibacillus harenae]MDQ0061552.1 multicomponent Na+:H+ antiporter subunit G [Paenibacillus harenae]MDQ0113189.1 multicomponent Na+:H+ antiporter subunit G [Paenibacillus harenae]